MVSSSMVTNYSGDDAVSDLGGAADCDFENETMMMMMTTRKAGSDDEGVILVGCHRGKEGWSVRKATAAINNTYGFLNGWYVRKTTAATDNSVYCSSDGWSLRKTAAAINNSMHGS